MVARRRLGLGYDLPGYDDCYADGSPCKGSQGPPAWWAGGGSTATFNDTTEPAEPADSADPASAAAPAPTCTARHIAHNPPAGAVRRHELSAPWMAATLDLCHLTTCKADALILDKRVLGLARQTVAGLADVGTKYDVTEMAILLRAAFDFRALAPEAQQALPESKRALAMQANQVLDAARRYDCRKVAYLLQLQLPSPKTFGEGVPL